MNDLEIANEKVFEDIKHVDENGDEYWYARELQKVFDYTQWRRFENVIDKAIVSCGNSNNVVLDHFAGIGNMEYIDHQFVAAQIQAQQRIGGNSYVLLRAAVGQHADAVKELLDRRTLIGGQIAYFYNTLFGPAGVTAGYSNRTKKPYLYLNLGYEF